MAEFDLIPDEYVRGRILRRRMKYFFGGLASIAGLVALMWTGLHALLVMQRSEVARLQEEARLTSEAKARQDQDRERERSAQQQLQALDELRGRDRMLVFLEAIDAAYAEGVWFDDLRFFRRERRPVPAPRAVSAPAPGTGRGVDPTRLNAPAAQLPEFEQGAEIAGYAGSPSALAEFVRKLGEQPGISGVRLIDSGMRANAEVPAIEARIAMLIEGKSRRPQ